MFATVIPLREIRRRCNQELAQDLAAEVKWRLEEWHFIIDRVRVVEKSVEENAIRSSKRTL
jgi:hypothetical protein